MISKWNTTQILSSSADRRIWIGALLVGWTLTRWRPTNVDQPTRFIIDIMALRSPRILEIFTGTWNMGNAAPDRDSLEQFIPHHGGPYDVLAIGLQESQYKVAAGAASAKSSSVKASSSGGNLTKTSSFMEKLGKALDPSIADLLQQICDILGPEYHVVDHASRYQMQLVVFAHATLLKSITHVEKTAENTGILHVLPNKGGLCISFTVDDTKVAFIAAHLAAHEGPKKCAVRNDNVCEILGGVRAGDRRFDVCAQVNTSSLLFAHP
jgi:hypothetical protein